LTNTSLVRIWPFTYEEWRLAIFTKLQRSPDLVTFELDLDVEDNFDARTLDMVHHCGGWGRV